MGNGESGGRFGATFAGQREVGTHFDQPETLLPYLQAALGRQYAIQRQVGQGALGVVYRAEDVAGRAVALKVLRPQLVGAAGVDRLLRELTVLARLSHPNILQILSFGRIQETVYYVAPYLDEGSLRQRLQSEGPLPFGDVLRIAQEISEALAYAHAHGVIHRDINAENVLIDRNHVVVKDFWIARALLATHFEDKLTGAGVPLGPPANMSPEQASGSEPVGPRSDVYSLACLVMELLTGSPLPAALGYDETRHVMFGHKSSARIVGRFALWPPTVWAAVGKALETSPTERFANPRDFVRALAPPPAAPRESLKDRVQSRFRRLVRGSPNEHLIVPSRSDPLARLRNALRHRYVVRDRVGRGGMATVYVADDLRYPKKQVAIKVLRPELAASVASERFLQEIGITAVLTHPLIIPLLDSGDADGDLFYVMPYIQGVSLRDKLDTEKRFAIAEALRIAADIGGALDYAHRNGVVHRDIKPENIMLYENLALISDFGIALALDRAGRLTREGSPGTPAYMSPEQLWEPESVDHRSDVYSVACVVFEMLVGTPPFTGRSDRDVAAKHLNAPVPRLRSFRNELPETIDRAVGKALAKSPLERFQSVREFATALAVV